MLDRATIRLPHLHQRLHREELVLTVDRTGIAPSVRMPYELSSDICAGLANAVRKHGEQL